MHRKIAGLLVCLTVAPAWPGPLATCSDEPDNGAAHAACPTLIAAGALAGPDLAFAHFRRGTALSEMGRQREAIADFDRSLLLDPGQPVAHDRRGMADSALGRFADALADHTRALALAPDDPITLGNRGSAHLGAGSFDAAIADDTRALKILPEDAVYLGNRGFACCSLDRIDRALADCDAALALDCDPVVCSSRGGPVRPLAICPAPSPILIRRCGSIPTARSH